MHHLRNDLTADQILLVCSVAMRYMHNPYLSNQTTVLATKITFQMIEAIIGKFTQAEAGRLICTIMESFVDKLESMVAILTEVVVLARTPDIKDREFNSFIMIEKARPVEGATYAVEKPEELALGKLLLIGS